MKKLFFPALLSLAALVGMSPAATAQAPGPQKLAYYCNPGPGFNRFTEMPVISDTDPDSIKVAYNLLYRQAQPWNATTLQSLYMDVYYPDTTLDPLRKRPFILLVFGGGFTDGDRTMMNNYCYEFAKRGFVAATIDYRLGKNTKDCTDPITGDPDPYSDEKAQYRAIQDGDAAMRYIVAHAADFKIDTAWLFAGGYSAGAGICNGLVYVEQSEANTLIPLSPNIEAQLGPIRGTGNKYKIKGIFNNWGGINLDYFDAGQAVPMVGFHGANDKVVPVGVDIKYGDKVPACGMNDSIMGTVGLFDSLSAHHICVDISILGGTGHGAWNGTQAGLLFRVGRAACFFKQLMCGTCNPNNPYSQLIDKSHATDFDQPGGPALAHCSQNSSPMNGAFIAGVSGTPVVYPNPATGDFQLLHLDHAAAYHAALYDLSGRLIRSYVPVAAGASLSLQGIRPGIYFLRIINRTQAATTSLKVVVE
ncbi:T9SS type A sorting domain-containing protein [Taibaiella koreensis]|uniref:T9SS type A sorting domain-containing protein n=1 Tax=Taibaiella koreensis TaxID=1268548 RepID=UPI000E59A1DD|nr:T9SS type A sorting domain-containing protein [Taibaiella koreensis]